MRKISKSKTKIKKKKKTRRTYLVLMRLQLQQLAVKKRGGEGPGREEKREVGGRIVEC